MLALEYFAMLYKSYRSEINELYNLLNTYVAITCTPHTFFSCDSCFRCLHTTCNNHYIIYTYFFAFVSSAGVFLRCITASAKFGSFIKKKRKRQCQLGFMEDCFQIPFLNATKDLLLTGIYLKFYW